MRHQSTISSLPRWRPSCSFCRVAAGTLSLKNARTSSRNATSSLLKLRSIGSSCERMKLIGYQITSVIPGRAPCASPESITTIVSMDSRPAPSGASRNDDLFLLGHLEQRRSPHPSRPTSRCELLLFRPRRLAVAQFVAREFADRGARQLVDEFECCGNFMLAELAGKERLEFVERKSLGAGAQFDKGFGGLPAIVVGNADHDHFLHRRMPVDRLLDHLRIDVEAA